MSRTILTTVLLALAVLFAGCTQAENCDTNSQLPECVPTTNTTPVTTNIPVEFENSYFFDTSASTWKTIDGQQAGVGTITNTINIFSENVNLDTAVALNRILGAKSQFELNQTTDVSNIPYIELKAVNGIRYIFRYQKRDTAGNIVYQMTGSVPVQGNRHILPLINATFNNQLYAANATAGIEYAHKLSISVQKAGTSATNIQDLQFRTIYMVTNLDFDTKQAPQIQNLTVSNRWNYFFSDNNGTVPNANLRVLSLEQKNRTGEVNPLDVRVSFKDVPKITVTQVVFNEVPFNLSHFVTTKSATGFPELIPSRGYEFKEKTIVLDSLTEYVSGSEMVTAIGMNLYVAGTEVHNATITDTNVTKETDRSYIVRSVPPLTPFDVSFGLNFSTDPSILSPMKPICHEEKGLTFNPVVADRAKAAAVTAGNYYAHCHPDTLQTETIAAGDSSKVRTDMWFGSFNYAPYKALPARGVGVYQLGTFNGVKEVVISIQGCVKIDVKSPGGGSSSWQTKTQGGSACGVGFERYAYFNFQKKVSIFDLVYPTTDGLTTILGQYINSVPTNSEVIINRTSVVPGMKKLF